MTDRSWPRKRHRRDRCGPPEPRSHAFLQGDGTRRSGPGCSSDCTLPNCTLRRWPPSSPASLLPIFYIFRIRRLSHPSDILMRKYLGDVVQELTEFGVVGRIPTVASLLSRPIANDFRWYAAHRLSATRRLSLHHRRSSP